MDPMKTHGAFSWNELMTTDVEGAKKFYSELFGWTYEEMHMDEGGSYTSAKVGDSWVAGIYHKPGTVPAEGPPYWGGDVTVNDVDASSEKARSLGGKVLVEPTDIPKVGRFSVIQDPQGAVISLIKYAEMK